VARTLEIDRAVDLYLDHCKVERGLAANTLDGYAAIWRGWPRSWASAGG
jgi:hypothetical protein